MRVVCNVQLTAVIIVFPSNEWVYSDKNRLMCCGDVDVWKRGSGVTWKAAQCIYTCISKML